MIKSPEKEIDMILEKNENFVINESMIPPEMSVTIDNARELAREFRDLRMRYHAAIKEISTKLEVLDNEFSVRNDYNPIHHMQCRLKSIESIVDKIGRKGWPMEMESVYKVMDFAGVRVVCNYIDDIYTVEESLLRQDDIKLLKRKGLYKEPQGERLQEPASAGGSPYIPVGQDLLTCLSRYRYVRSRWIPGRVLNMSSNIKKEMPGMVQGTGFNAKSMAES